MGAMGDAIELGRRIAAASAGVALCLAFAAPATAKTYVVNSRSDHVPASCSQRHDCTLREAVRAANAHSGGDKIVLEGGKVYKFAQAGAGEDAAMTGDLDTTGALKIVHTGAHRPVIDANGLDRVFHAQFFAGKLSLNGLVIRGGNVSGGFGGGGVETDGGGAGIDIRGCILAHNQAVAGGGGVLANGSQVTIVASRVEHNTSGSDGGGLWTNSPMKVDRSTIKGNHSAAGPFGGGAALIGGAGSSLLVTRSTVNGNTAAGSGGAFYNDVGQLTVRNSTLSGNRANGSGGGIVNDESAFGGNFTKLNDVTLVRNQANADGIGVGFGGGMTRIPPFGPPVPSATHVENSLIALNTVGAGGGDPNCNGSFDSGGHNLRSTSDPGCSGFAAATDLVRANPRLGGLKSNGGATKTVALLRHSPAIGHAGKATSEKRDQRGVMRDADPDIGAFERR
jgi:CSLREA domain-containing protein